MIVTRRELEGRAADAFRAHGFDGASISVLSEATGLRRASLYHHFPGGKDEMAASVLARVSAEFTRTVLAPLGGRADPRARILAMVDGLDRFYDGGTKACLIDVFSFGTTQAPLRAALGRAVAYWVDVLARTLAEAGLDPESARGAAEDAVIAVEGALVLARATGSTEPFRRTLSALPGRLIGPGAGAGGGAA
jgi:AcrR family transcriptional regulator